MIIVTGIKQDYEKILINGGKVVSVSLLNTYFIDYELKIGETWQEQCTQITTDEKLTFPRAEEILKDSLRQAFNE
ncbi:hypothetical protein [Virgibacillus salexigens]|uniref:hypothetical protein n=1 Tax=Virgibacillus salexigens TaxID=61016 RepID=UPI0019098FF0|nr:hypothetical protein [Virgibacillus salexigens]